MADPADEAQFGDRVNGGYLRLEDCAVVLAKGQYCDDTTMASPAEDAPAGVVRLP